MRGSAKYQVTQLFKQIDARGASKHTARDAFTKIVKELGISATAQNFAERSGVYSHNTADMYRIYWRECLNFAKENYGVKDIEKIDSKIITSYMRDKIRETTNLNTIDKIGAAITKMGVALDRLHNFDINTRDRLDELARVKSGEQLFNYQSDNMATSDKFRAAIDLAKVTAPPELHTPHQSRNYQDYRNVIEHLESDTHKTACRLIQELGMRAHELSLIKEGQLKDDNTLRYISKGGQYNERGISQELADKLRGYFERNGGAFEVDKKAFRADIKQACAATGEDYNGIHGFRWSVAQEMMANCLIEGHDYKESLALVSEFLTHHRVDITKHYLQRG
jgi:integrase